MWEKWATSSSSKWLRTIIAGILWLLAFLGVSGTEQFIHGQHNVSWYVWRAIEFGLVIAGGLVVLQPVEWWCRRKLKQWTEWLGRGIEVRYVRADEADTLFKFCRTFYTRDDHVINRDSLEAFLKANPNTAKIFSKGGQPVGLYIVFGINTKAVQQLLAGTIESAQQLNARHAVRGWRWASGLYVTNVSARVMVARGMVMRELKTDLVTYVNKYSSIKYVFARLANADGARIIRKNGFTKVRQHLPEAQIWKYEVGPRLPTSTVS